MAYYNTEFVGTSQADSIFMNHGYDLHVYYGVGGNDVFSLGSHTDAVAVGGSGNDTYAITSDQDSILAIIDQGNSPADTLIYNGAEFNQDLATVILDGKDLAMADLDSWSLSGVYIHDWLNPENQIEQFIFDNGTFSIEDIKNMVSTHTSFQGYYATGDYINDHQLANEADQAYAEIEQTAQQLEFTHAPQAQTSNISGFDANYYLKQYPDVAYAGIDPQEHYTLYGAAEGRNPNAEFNEQAYLAHNPDVAHAVQNGTFVSGYDHYMKHGQHEGRGLGQAAPSETVEGFDANWYLAQYSDVAAAGADPLTHYIHYGAAEGRDPNPSFDESFYLETHQDVANAVSQGNLDSGYEHYLLYGQEEGRIAVAGDTDSSMFVI